MKKHKWNKFRSEIVKATDERARKTARRVHMVECLKLQTWDNPKYQDNLYYCNALHYSTEDVLRAYYWNRSDEYLEGFFILNSIVQKNEFRFDAEGRCYGLLENDGRSLNLMNYHLSCACISILCADSAWQKSSSLAAKASETFFLNEISVEGDPAEISMDDDYIGLLCEYWTCYLLLGDYENIIKWYEKSFGNHLIDTTTVSSAHMGIRLCYLLAKLRAGKGDEWMQHGAEGTLSFLKLDWIGSNIKKIPDQTYHLSRIILLTFLCKSFSLEEKNLAVRLFDELSPEKVVSEVEILETEL